MTAARGGPRMGCALLAGGAARRMGGRDKADLAYAGETFLRRAVRELEAAGLPCYLSTGREEREPPAGWSAVPDEPAATGGGGIGPMGGILACLRRARVDGLEGLFFMPCDAPLYTHAALLRLRERVGEGEDWDAAAFRTAEGRLQPTFGWYSVRCLPALEACVRAGDYRLTGLLGRVRLLAVDAAGEGIDGRQFANVNTQEDYARLTKGEAP